MSDALDDAIRRAYCQPVHPPVEGEDPELVDMLAKTAILTDPNRMRHLAALQAAAWEVVRTADSERRERMARELVALTGEIRALGGLPQHIRNRIHRLHRLNLTEEPTRG